MVINYVRIFLQCICKNAQFHESSLLISSDNGSILYGEDYFSACTLPENILLIIRKQCFHENRPSIKTTFIMDGSLKNRLNMSIKKRHPRKDVSVKYLDILDYLFSAVATSTAQATVQPTIGLLPIPRKPIISTCAGTDEEPAN